MNCERCKIEFESTTRHDICALCLGAIQYINDTLRTTMITTPTCKLNLTNIVYESPDREKILTAIRNYDWTGKEDPYLEHDFGAVKVNDATYYFKFSYYDKNLKNHGYNTHVLTIMRCDEY